MQDISNVQPAAAGAAPAAKALTLGEAVAQLKAELGFDEDMGARQVVTSAWTELGWAEREGPLKQLVGDVCAEMGIATGWPGGVVAAAAAAAASTEPPAEPESPDRPEPAAVSSSPAGLENYKSRIGASPPCTPEHVIEARSKRRMAFLEAEAGVVEHAEKFVGRSLSEALQGQIDSREPEAIEDDDEEDEEEEPAQEEGEAVRVHSRSERKARKAMLKLGMAPVPNVNRCTMKKSSNVLFVIEQPDVFKCGAGTESYVVFGEVQVEDMGARAQASAAQQFRTAQELPAAQAQQATIQEEDEQEEEEEEEGEVDEAGLVACDLELVMAQSGAARPKAARSDPRPRTLLRHFFPFPALIKKAARNLSREGSESESVS